MLHQATTELLNIEIGDEVPVPSPGAYTADLTVLTLGQETKIAAQDQALLESAGIKIVYDTIEKLTQEGDRIAAWQDERAEPLYFDTVYSALGMRLRSDLAVSVGAKSDDDGALLVRHQQTTARRTQ